MKTVEDTYKEWSSKVSIYRDLLLKLPISEAHYGEWVFVKNELVRAQRMVELIEKHLL